MDDYIIRPMEIGDLGAINKIDRSAFETYRRQHRQLIHPMQLRTRENMQAAFQRPHPGVVVEWPLGRVVGYCFTHVWGSLGWLGTLGVNPKNQGFGLGRAVITAGLDLLRQAGCSMLALETMPESGKNLALYTRLGLEARQLTLLLQGTPYPAATQTFERWHGSDALHQVSSQIVPGLDPTPAAVWLESEKAGDTLVWYEDGVPSAFAILRSRSRRAASGHSYLTAEAVGCAQWAARHWPRYLGEMQVAARRQGKSGIVLPVNARQITLLRDLLDAGLRISYSRVRMVTGAPLGAPDAILTLTLAM